MDWTNLKKTPTIQAFTCYVGVAYNCMNNHWFSSVSIL